MDRRVGEGKTASGYIADWLQAVIWSSPRLAEWRTEANSIHSGWARKCLFRFLGGGKNGSKAKIVDEDFGLFNLKGDDQRMGEAGVSGWCSLIKTRGGGLVTMRNKWRFLKRRKRPMESTEFMFNTRKR